MGVGAPALSSAGSPYSPAGLCALADSILDSNGVPRPCADVDPSFTGPQRALVLAAVARISITLRPHIRRQPSQRRRLCRMLSGRIIRTETRRFPRCRFTATLLRRDRVLG